MTTELGKISKYVLEGPGFEAIPVECFVQSQKPVAAEQKTTRLQIGRINFNQSNTADVNSAEPLPAKNTPEVNDKSKGKVNAKKLSPDQVALMEKLFPEILKK